METQRKIGTSSDGRVTHFTAGVLLSHEGKYLLLDRKNIPFGFACPGGHREEDEDPKAAALREVFEETGITLDDVELVCEEEVPWNYCRSATVHYWYLYKAETKSDAFVSNEEEAKSMRWYTQEEIKNLVLEPVWKYWFERLKII